MLIRLASFLALMAFAPASVGLFDGHADVGITPKTGDAKFDSAKREYAVTGGGANIWGNADAFHFVHRKVTGDFTITADARFIGNGVVAHRKADLMVRQTLDAGSPYAGVAVHGDGLTSLQYRKDKDGITAELKSAMKAPVRIRLQRRGDELIMSTSMKPGDDFTTSDPVTVPLGAGPVYLGLAVCSHDANVLETAVFSNVIMK